MSSLKTQMRSWWTLDEASGSRFDSHASFTLTDVNTVTSTTGHVSGNAAVFTAANNEELTNGSITLAIDDFAVAFWVYVIGASTGTLLGKDAGAANREFQIWHQSSNGPFRYFVAESAVTFDFLDTTNSYANDAWHFVYIDYRDSDQRIRIKVNGDSIDSKISAAQVTDAPSAIFTLGGTNLSWSDCRLDEVATWVRLLTDTEIGWLYNDGNGITYTDI